MSTLTSDCGHCHDDPPIDHTCPRCGASARALPVHGDQDSDATAEAVLRQLAAAEAAGLPEIYSVELRPGSYDREVRYHLYVGGHHGGPEDAVAAVGPWRDWWTRYGATGWHAASQGDHHELRGEWRGWAVVLAWIGKVAAADMVAVGRPQMVGGKEHSDEDDVCGCERNPLGHTRAEHPGDGRPRAQAVPS